MRTRKRAIGVAAGLVTAFLLTQIPGSPLRLSFLVGSRLGTLAGTVRLEGDGVVLPTAVSNATDPDVCGREQSLEDLLVDASDRGVENAIVAFVDVPPSVDEPLGPRRIVLDNHRCRFAPHVSVAALGDTIVAANRDPIFHTTHYYGPLNSNVALSEPGQTHASVVDQVGIITVLCDLHGWMRAFIRVDEHRLHAVSDPHGRFRIRGIPPGSYTVEVWHEKLGSQRVPIQIERGRTTHIDVEYSPPGTAR